MNWTTKLEFSILGLLWCEGNETNHQAKVKFFDRLCNAYGEREIGSSDKELVLIFKKLFYVSHDLANTFMQMHEVTPYKDIQMVDVVLAQGIQQTYYEKFYEAKLVDKSFPEGRSKLQSSEFVAILKGLEFDWLFDPCQIRLIISMECNNC